MTTAARNYAADDDEMKMVDEIFASSNPLVSWLRCIERLMRAVQPATSNHAT